MRVGPPFVASAQLLAIVAIAACNSSNSVDGDAQPAGAVDAAPGMDQSRTDQGPVTSDASAGPSVSCQAITIQSKADLVAVLDGLTWAAYLPSLSNNTLSAPYTIAQSLAVHAQDLALPPNCAANNGCFQQVSFSRGFSVDPLPAGVAFHDEVDVATSVYEKLTLNNVTVRFRAVMENTHPFKYNFVPRIMVEPDCATSCGSSSALCPKDRLCHATAAFCTICLNLDKKDCACHEGAELMADGETCSYISNTMSTVCDGSCKAGKCVYAGTPDVYCP